MLNQDKLNLEKEMADCRETIKKITEDNQNIFNISQKISKYPKNPFANLSDLDKKESLMFKDRALNETFKDVDLSQSLIFDEAYLNQDDPERKLKELNE